MEIVIPKEQRAVIIKAHHNPATCEHLDISKTVARLAKVCYWPKMKKDVANYIRHCVTCLKTKPLQQPLAGQMLSAQTAVSAPWQLISADLVGPLPRSRSGYTYIFSVCDRFSKFVPLFPLRSATAANVTEQVILIYGATNKILVDNGVQFTSSLFRNMLKEYDVIIQYNANYHPQANPV